MDGLLRHITRTLNRASGSALIRTAINNRLQEKAKVLNLNIDPKNQTIEVEVHIKGQPGPFKIKVDGYELTSENGRDQLRWSKITIDRGAANLPPGTKDKLSYVM